jgi:uncharacterized protein (DUF3084 family)
MSQMRGYMSELSSISEELKRLNAHRRKLLARKKQLEAKVLEVLDKQKQSGVKYKGQQWQTTERNIRGRKKLVEQKQDGLAVLQKYGVRNGELILEEVMKAMKNEAVPQKRLKAPKKAEK